MDDGALPPPRLTVLGEFLRYAGVGAFSYGLSLGMSALLHETFGLRQEAAVALSLSVALVTNFWLARVFIFRSGSAPFAQFLRFGAVSALMRGVDYLCFLALLRLLGLNYLLALTIAMAFSNGVKFILYRTMVFRSSDSSLRRR